MSRDNAKGNRRPTNKEIAEENTGYTAKVATKGGIIIQCRWCGERMELVEEFQQCILCERRPI